MAKTPQVKSGKGINQIDAEDFNRMAKMAMRRVSVGPGLNVSETADGIRITLVETSSLTQPRDATVLVVREPNRDFQMLTVRKVAYRSAPPFDRADCGPGQHGVCPYRWDGPEFVAYPDFGHLVMDYAPLVCTNAQPDMEASYLRAFYANSVWHVEMPGGTATGERMVVVREYGGEPPDPGSDQIIVQEVGPEIMNNAHTGNYITIAEPVVIKVWPNLVAGYYRPFLWRSAEITARTTILPAVQINGVFYLKQRGKMPVSLRHGPVKTLDCAPVTEEA